jgi:hypothetical protein
MKKLLIVLVGAVISLVGCGEGSASGITEKGSCDKGGVYSKQFNCEYIYNKATYDVYYWRYLNSDKSDRKVGTVVGLSSCRDTAIYAHRDANGKMKQNLEWSDRMYVCMLIKDGRNLEKHRY